MRGTLHHFGSLVSLRLQVPHSHLLTQNLYDNYYSQDLEYPIIGYMDPYRVYYRKSVGLRGKDLAHWCLRESGGMDPVTIPTYSGFRV